LAQVLDHAASAWPDASAVIDRDRTLTYEDLAGKAAGLARLLRDVGIDPGDRVGVFLDKSLEAVTGIWGVLLAGAAYVPFDPQAPPARLAYIAADAGIRCLLTARNKAPAWTQLVESGAPIEHLVVLDGIDGPELGAETPAGVKLHDGARLTADERLGPPTTSHDLAYILYTSGSTGEPKGVMLSHGNALTFVEWAAEEFSVGPGDVLSSHAPFHFDLSVFDLFAAAWGGAPVALVPPTTSMFPMEVRRFIERHGITVWYSVPSLLTMLTLRGGLVPGSLPSLRTILFAGEVFPTRYLRQLMAALPHVEFNNLYGPTETNVCTWYRVPPLPDDADEPIPIGRPIADTDAFAVVDGRRAGVGEVGELYVRGGTVMQGYWADPERTARGLVPHPLAPGREPAYRTGDLVRRRDDGRFEFLGRRDSQVKSRGYRIELGDIETAVYAHPGVEECAVVTVPDELVTNLLHCFVVLRDGTTVTDVTARCRARLPRYMVPTFESVPDLPKTSTGKTDRQNLARRAAQAYKENEAP
jgi:amino acid adenylation domain-containing protein